MNTAQRALLLVIAGCLVLTRVGYADAAVDKVGTVKTVKNVVYSIKPGQTKEIVSPFDAVVRKEVVETEADSALTIFLNDGSELAVGSNSELSIDEFVFDAASSTGSSILRLAKGAMRFVSGQMAYDGVRLLTPTSSIGIRGSEGLIWVSRLGSLRGRLRRMAEDSLGSLFAMTSGDAMVTILEVLEGEFTISERSGESRTLPANAAVAALAYRLGEVVKSGGGGDGASPDHAMGSPPAAEFGGLPKERAVAPIRRRAPSGGSSASTRPQDGDGISCVTVAEKKGKPAGRGFVYRRVCDTMRRD